MKDVYEMFRIIMMERKRREIDPTLKILRETVEEAAKSRSASDQEVLSRLEGMLEFFELANQWAETTQKISTPSLLKAAKMGEKVFKLLGLGGG
jgi:DNA-binding transcriptional regulator GbsR (MarR family)